MTVADILLIASFGLAMSFAVAACEQIGRSDYCRCPRCLLRALRRHLHLLRWPR